MDYESLHGLGISNFSSSSQHRMPTVSAAQAIQDLETSSTRCISTGLPFLDFALQNREAVVSDVEPFYGGVSKGKVTEIYGPPGVGKTALGTQIAASVLHGGGCVTWVDGSHPLPGLRLLQTLKSFPVSNPVSQVQSSPPSYNTSDLLTNLTHFSTPTLAHLLALFSHPTPSHPSPNTSLIIVDSLSTLIATAFPRPVDSQPSAPKRPGAPAQPNPLSRKFPVLQHLLNTLQKLAATRNISIIILTQCATKMRPGIGAVLVPSISSTAWEQGLACRVVLFRDWGWDDADGNPIADVRLAQVIKAEGLVLPSGGRLAGFSITSQGLMHLELPTSTPFIITSIPPKSTPLPKIIPQKRKIETTEIPDSDAEDDEDYGWAEEDEEDVPVMPPQWQGSEDILIPAPEELEEVEAEENGEEEDSGVVKEGGLEIEDSENSEDELGL